jgi:hypothetical protein
MVVAVGISVFVAVLDGLIVGAIFVGVGVIGVGVLVGVEVGDIAMRWLFAAAIHSSGISSLGRLNKDFQSMAADE